MLFRSVLALSQLSRATELREKAEPRLSDLRESGAIEQDADVVIFLYRESDRTEETNVKGETITFSVAKHRNGPTGRNQLWFLKDQTRFQNLVRKRDEHVEHGGDSEQVM